MPRNDPSQPRERIRRVLRNPHAPPASPRVPPAAIRLRSPTIRRRSARRSDHRLGSSFERSAGGSLRAIHFPDSFSCAAGLRERVLECDRRGRGTPSDHNRPLSLATGPSRFTTEGNGLVNSRRSRLTVTIGRGSGVLLPASPVPATARKPRSGGSLLLVLHLSSPPNRPPRLTLPRNPRVGGAGSVWRKGNIP